MKTWRLPCLSLAAFLVAACSPLDANESEEVAEGGWDIVNGLLDTTSQAVVRWDHGSQCSATIVRVVGTTGYALTAGHCVGGTNGTLKQGNNASSPVRTYTVQAQEAHPGYAVSDAYDFAMLRFSGADGTTPVIDAETTGQDNIAAGTQLDMVGYGLTENGGTNQRHHVVKPVDWETVLFLAFDQSNSGMCSGDSGGAVLHQGRVAGVNSFVTDTNCVGPGVYGVAMRVSAIKSTFIEPFINGTPYLDQTCNQCSEAHYLLGFGICGDLAQTCWDNPDCDAYTTCVNDCQTSACTVQCAMDHPSGKNLYDTFESCLCNTACPDECANASWCEPLPACWLSSGDPTCQSCIDGSCCTQATACAADTQCSACLNNPANPACLSNPEVVALDTCLTGCNADCAILEGGGGTGGGGTGGGGVGGGSVGGGSVGGGSVGGGSVGGGTTSSSSGNDGDDDGMVVEEGGCSVSSRRPENDRWVWLLVGLGLFARRRRR